MHNHTWIYVIQWSLGQHTNNNDWFKHICTMHNLRYKNMITDKTQKRRIIACKQFDSNN